MIDPAAQREAQSPRVAGDTLPPPPLDTAVEERHRATPTQLDPQPDPEDGPELWARWANRLPSLVELRMSCLSVTPEESHFKVLAGPIPLNPKGELNGGVVAAVIDQAMGVVGVRAAGCENRVVTGALHIQFHSPAYPPVTMAARLLPSGGRVKFVEVVMSDCRGRRCASGQGTMVIRRFNT